MKCHWQGCNNDASSSIETTHGGLTIVRYFCQNHLTPGEESLKGFKAP